MTSRSVISIAIAVVLTVQWPDGKITKEPFPSMSLCIEASRAVITRERRVTFPLINPNPLSATCQEKETFK